MSAVAAWKSVCAQLYLKMTLTFMCNSNHSHFWLPSASSSSPRTRDNFFNSRPHGVYASTQPKQVRFTSNTTHAFGIHTLWHIRMYMKRCHLFTIRLSYAFQFHHRSHITMRCLWIQLIAPDWLTVTVSVIVVNTTPLLVSTRSLPSIAAASRYDSDTGRYGQCR